MFYLGAFTSLSILLVSVKGTAQVAPAHIVIVVLENRAYSQLRGNPAAPFINSIIADAHTATLTQSFGLMHPSQPNYLQLFSGSNQGVITNNSPAVFPFTTLNLGASLIAKKFGFTGYSEDLPSVGYNGDISGAYARKHNPWVNWQDAPVNGIPFSQNRLFADFPTDFSTLPTVSFVVPNQNNDMHNGSLALTIPQGDTWLQNNLGNYVEWCKTHNSLFILTFDEDDGSHNNQILTTITGESISGGIYDQPVTHYNILRTIEELYQLPPAGSSADSTAVQYIWNAVAICKGAGSNLQSNLSGTNYQWQVNSGNGFTNITNNSNYNGVNTRKLQLSNIPSTWNGYKYRNVVDGVASDPVTIRLFSYWTGAVSTAWENPLNWSCGSLPDSNTDVIINTSSTVLLSSTVLIRSFSLSAGAIFQNNGQLTLLH